MKTSTAPSSAARPFAPSDRKLASPWIRDLKTGAARRECLVSGQTVAFVAPSHVAGEWITFATSAAHSTGLFLDARDGAKAAADFDLVSAGWTLVRVPG